MGLHLQMLLRYTSAVSCKNQVGVLPSSIILRKQNNVIVVWDLNVEDHNGFTMLSLNPLYFISVNPVHSQEMLIQLIQVLHRLADYSMFL